jgi:hypothetical protein
MLVELSGAKIEIHGVPDQPAMEVSIGDDLVLAGPREEMLFLMWALWTHLGNPPMEPGRVPELPEPK